MSDAEDDWGMGNQQAPKQEAQKQPNSSNVAEAEKEPKKEEKQEEENPNDQSASWIVTNNQPEKKVEEPARGRRGQEKTATVEDKVEELKPDKHDDSLWCDEKNPTQEEKQEEERNNERSGRGRGNREGQQDNGRGNRGYNRNYQGNENGGGRGNRQQEGNYRGRGNRENGDRPPRENGDRPPRENGYNGYRGGDRGGDRGGYRGGDRGGERESRGNWGNQGDRGEGGDRNDGERGRGRGRGRGNFHNDRNDRNYNNRPQQTAIAQKKPQAPLPKGKNSWPECSIYIFGAKLTLTLRKIHDFQCKLLVTPFLTPKLQLYPGSIVNQSRINYKQKIAKKEELKNAGQVYFQKALGIGSFEGIAFLKVDEAEKQSSLRNGVRKIFQILQVIEGANLQSVVFGLSEQLGNPLPIINQLIKCMQNTEKVKELYLSTIQPKCFLDGIDAFKEKMETLFDENEVSTD